MIGWRGWLSGGGRDARQTLGLRGERIAGRFLRRAGYRVVGRRVRVPMGEADLVALAPDGVTPVIVEVKTRRAGGERVMLAPEVALDAKKRRKLVTIARHLASCNGWADPGVRVDLVAVECPDRGRAVVRHHVGVVRV